MNKTTFALAIAASLFAASASAQVNLGGAVQGGLHAGALPPSGAMNAPLQRGDQLGQRLGDRTRRLDAKARRSTRQTADQANAAARARRRAHADAHGATAASAGPLNGQAAAQGHADVTVNPAPLSDRASGAARSLGSDVRQTAHSATAAGGRTAGSVGTHVRDATHGGTAVRAQGSGRAQGGASESGGLDADAAAAGTLQSASNPVANDRQNGVRSTPQTARQKNGATVNADAAGHLDTH